MLCECLRTLPAEDPTFGTWNLMHPRFWQGQHRSEYQGSSCGLTPVDRRTFVGREVSASSTGRTCSSNLRGPGLLAHGKGITASWQVGLMGMARMGTLSDPTHETQFSNMKINSDWFNIIFTCMVSHPMHGKTIAKEMCSVLKGIYMYLPFWGQLLRTGHDPGFRKINQHIQTFGKSLSGGKWIAQTVHHQVLQFPWHPGGNQDTETIKMYKW